MPCGFQISPDYLVNYSNPCFIIAEVGQNHQGDLNIAKQLIDAAKEAGANCVKFQKTCLVEKFNIAALYRPYNGPHSWGSTYGEHKAYLEFSLEEFRELQRHATDIGIMFSSSAMDCTSVDDLVSLDVPFLKIGSGDANNFLLLEYAVSKKIPLVISTGMQNMETVRDIYHLMKKHKAEFCLLHCVSSYPVPPEQVNLEVINAYRSEFPDIQVGYSGHELGITICIGAVAMGARILERHLTLDKTWKGTDHQSSLTPVEFRTMVKEIRLLEKALGGHIKQRQPCELPCYMKLGKTIVASRLLKKGDMLSKSDLKVKVAEPKGCPAENINILIGKRLLRDIRNDESILLTDVE